MLIMSLPAAVNLIWDKREHSLPAVGTLIRFRRTAALDVAVALNRRGHCLSVGTFGTSLGNDMLKCYNKWHIFCSCHFFFFSSTVAELNLNIQIFHKTLHFHSAQAGLCCHETTVLDPYTCTHHYVIQRTRMLNYLTPLDLENRCRSKKKGVLGYCNKIPR
jgi:hypothetical protein